ncbi:MAG: class I SAM-dependent methyltransferase [Methyloversatilis sp.]|nr:class I SAM-dependent methyltransferase [Methyloversatilis sp.]
MLSALKRWILASAHRPGWRGVVFNPFYLARRTLWRAIEAEAHQLRGELLDVGCGSKPYRALFAVDRYTGLDIDTPRTREQGAADHFYDGRTFPFGDASFDAVLCNQVLEHVFEPDAFITEIRRVLRPGGRVLLTVPFVWDEHEQPYDFARYTTFGLKALFERNGFRVMTTRRLLADATLFCQLFNAYVFKVSRSRSTVINAIITLLVTAPVTIAGLSIVRLLPDNDDLFLDQLVIAERI